MISLNQQQEYVTQMAVDNYYNKYSQVFQYAGLPGCGKSVVLNEIINRIGLDPLTEVAAMSYIGSASLVMRMKGLLNAKTAHSWLYDMKPVELRDEYGKIIYDDLLGVPIMVPKFVPVDHLDENIKLIAFDEGYSAPLSMRPQIERFGLPIITCGDPNQLPPVNDKPAFLTNGKIYYLTQRMRQLDAQDINDITDRVRYDLPLLNGYHGNSLVIDTEDITDNMLMWADVIICGKNSTRDNINKRIRNILGYGNSKLPRYGEKIVCRKNNWLESIKFDNGADVCLVNGLMGTVSNNPDVSSYDGKLFSLNFVPDLCPMVQFDNIRSNYKHMISDNNIRLKIRNNRYETGNMFEYGYAITSHVAQGSEWDKVLYIEEYVHPDIQKAMNIVGASRARHQLIYAKMKKW